MVINHFYSVQKNKKFYDIISFGKANIKRICLKQLLFCVINENLHTALEHLKQILIDCWLIFFCLYYYRFAYTSIGIGVSLCVIACLGHLAADVNGYFLSCVSFSTAYTKQSTKLILIELNFHFWLFLSYNC